MKVLTLTDTYSPGEICLQKFLSLILYLSLNLSLSLSLPLSLYLSLSVSLSPSLSRYSPPLFISFILFSPFFGSLCLSTVLNYDNNDDKFCCITFSISINATLSLSPFTSRLSDNLIEMKTHKSIQVLVNPRCPLSMTSLHFL